MVNLEFGLNRAIPETAKVAWGCRFIMEPKGLLDFVYDRQSAAGEKVDEFLCKLNSIPVIPEIRKAWKKHYDRMGGWIEQNEDLILLYEDNGLKAIASTNASHGYVYVAVWESDKEEHDH